MPIVPPLFRNPETGHVEGYNVMALGQRGFGKTFIFSGDEAGRALDERDNIVVHDGKRTFKDKPIVQSAEWEVCETFDAAYKSQAQKICYSPSRHELRDKGARNSLCEWVLLRGNTTFYVDDGTLLCSQYDTPPALEDSWTTGRENGTEIWMNGQQPVELPSLAFTQTGVFFVFYCALQTHRDKIAGFVPIGDSTRETSARIRALKRHQFYYYSDDMEQALGPYTLVNGEVLPVPAGETGAGE